MSQAFSTDEMEVKIVTLADCDAWTVCDNDLSITSPPWKTLSFLPLKAGGHPVLCDSRTVGWKPPPSTRVGKTQHSSQGLLETGLCLQVDFLHASVVMDSLPIIS